MIIKYIKGNEKRILSNLSYSPPWPGNNLPKSLILSSLFTLDCPRSPKIAKIQVETHKIKQKRNDSFVNIEKVFEKEYFKDDRVLISIFMSPLNVHVTRYPISGKINYSKYHPGDYLVAWHPKSSEKNERTTIVAENDVFGEILYRQIAGALARRIVNYAEVGKEIVQGKDAGFIKFGSRVDLYLPINSKINVKLNQRLRGGEDIISEI